MMKRYEQNDSNSYILGISLIVEALKEVPDSVYKVILSSKAYKNAELEKLLLLCEENHIEVKEDDAIIEKLSLKENCYGIGFFNKYQRNLISKRHLLLYEFENLGELGTILRNAVSFGVQDVCLIHPLLDLFNPKVIRASMGSFFHLNIRVFDSLDDYSKEYDLPVLAFTGDGTIELNDLKLPNEYAVLIPQKYHALDGVFQESYYLSHRKKTDVSLTSLSSIVLNRIYYLNRVR